MVPSYSQGSRLPVSQNEMVMWSFTDETLQVIKERFEKGRGYNYWDQFYLIQPDIMVAAECTLEKINNPFLPLVAKNYTCPIGEYCMEELVNCRDNGTNCTEKVIFKQYFDTYLHSVDPLKAKMAVKDDKECLDACL